MNDSSTALQRLQQDLQPLRARLFAHPIYGTVDSLARLRAFMERHVFAVWDFMSLLKFLQRRLTCVEVPWVPAGNPAACRLVNEIVLGEESDADGRGGYLSHFELYVAAMQECGADIGPITRFLAALGRGLPPVASLEESGAPREARQFTSSTLALCDEGSLPAVAAAFTFGREDVVPEMFRRLVAGLAAGPNVDLSRFCYYLDRHIEVDEGEHGPMALQMLTQLCGDEAARWEEARQAAERAIEDRLTFWDDTAAAIRSG